MDILKVVCLGHKKQMSWEKEKSKRPIHEKFAKYTNKGGRTTFKTGKLKKLVKYKTFQRM